MYIYEHPVPYWRLQADVHIALMPEIVCLCLRIYRCIYEHHVPYWRPRGDVHTASMPENVCVCVCSYRCIYDILCHVGAPELKCIQHQCLKFCMYVYESVCMCV
jgi:hypothetical protein